MSTFILQIHRLVVFFNQKSLENTWFSRLLGNFSQYPVSAVRLFHRTHTFRSFFFASHIRSADIQSVRLPNGSRPLPRQQWRYKVLRITLTATVFSVVHSFVQTTRIDHWLRIVISAKHHTHNRRTICQKSVLFRGRISM